MIAHWIILVLATCYSVNGECDECAVPTLVYEDLKCVPKFSDLDTCCPVEYDCSHIYNQPKGTCQVKGKYYKPGDKPSKEDVGSDCSHARCTCSDKGLFDCIIPSDSCAEFWVPGFIKPGCYLAYEHNRCCHVEQKCPPFNENDAKCKVGETTYREGERFRHPTKKCTNCICDKTFNGKFDAPQCQRLNCTTETVHSKQLHKYCAPTYVNPDDCCPRSWLCPSDDGQYIPSSTPPVSSTPQCTFRDRLMYLGEKYLHGTTICECVIPPYLTCKPNLGGA